ncbi:hypothetical protein O6R08_07250 [Cutibacterium equinum]|uniref:Uncharacterized protein n=1 Tax=Cutibacterium equinum TaxID=3016342 RepID=A0ABY7QW94_9ACTN|nr:hypothetical protein [Cutibacterium equinum]WCC79331.1 hypothetical protein O6R08_07250 [Cutibacterium equinum]
MNTVEGTVRVMNALEAAQFTGESHTPNGEPISYKYVVFVFDKPTSFKAQTFDPESPARIDVAQGVRLGSKTADSREGSGFDLDGQRLTIRFKSRNCDWPSDTSLPLGQPSCRTFTVLG